MVDIAETTDRSAFRAIGRAAAAGRLGLPWPSRVGPIAYDLSALRMLVKRFGMPGAFADRVAAATGDRLRVVSSIVRPKELRQSCPKTVRCQELVHGFSDRLRVRQVFQGQAAAAGKRATGGLRVPGMVQLGSALRKVTFWPGSIVIL